MISSQFVSQLLAATVRGRHMDKTLLLAATPLDLGEPTSDSHTCFQTNGKTPLHYAVESLQLEAARFVLGRGSSGGDSDGNTDAASPARPGGREAEGIKLLEASQRTKLQVFACAHFVLQTWRRLCSAWTTFHTTWRTLTSFNGSPNIASADKWARGSRMHAHSLRSREATVVVQSFASIEIADFMGSGRGCFHGHSGREIPGSVFFQLCRWSLPQRRVAFFARVGGCRLSARVGDRTNFRFVENVFGKLGL